MSLVNGARIHITGVVQGVGFRPFVYSLAHRFSLTGWVRNTSAGVDIEVDGPIEALESFVQALRAEAPPLATIDQLLVEDRPPDGFTEFEIIPSRSEVGSYQPVSPDVRVCADCLRELSDPQDRRYRYPFINCTNCGPRFTIIKDVPYDRPMTTMAGFELCPDCAAEYSDPGDRRYHAQPVACPACGPHIWLVAGGDRAAEREEALQAARNLLAEGEIVAVKGLGGFHLACDAMNAEAVAELRSRKLRVDKPFAIMMPDVEAVREQCVIGPSEADWLLSPAHPIVVLARREGSTVAVEVAPGQETLGVMLPYSPLHVLLLERAPGFPKALVMTSGNLSEEPIAVENQDALERLSGLADAFLLHDRDIHTRCDDPVVRSFEEQIYPLRRSRGYAPFPVRLPWSAPQLLAAGAELKNTFCLTRDEYAFLSHHIGDMENYETLRSFEHGVAHFERLFRIRPHAIAYDLHPDYLASRYALERAQQEGIAAIGVQHHHAHIAALMAEHGYTGESPVIGVAFDGTGYGDDGVIWGGEFLLADYDAYQRLAHLKEFPLPGGDAAVREPWRIALALLAQAGLPWDEGLASVEAASAEARGVMRRQLEIELNAPSTTSMGRLFDGVAALAGVRQAINYEAQAAIEFEARMDPAEHGAYAFDIEGSSIDMTPMIHEVRADLRRGEAIERISARFHNGVAQMVAEVCLWLSRVTGVTEVALSGGVWQNMVLLERSVARLREAGFEVLVHRLVPANDGGLALGQAAIAARRWQNARSANLES